MKEKIIALAMSIAMFMMPIDAFVMRGTELPVMAEETVEPHIWDGSTDTSWYDSEEPYLEISTPEELAGMAALVNSGATMSGQTIKLKSDIYLNDVSHYEAWDQYTEEELSQLNVWKSIGGTHEFSGTFDGDRHTIYGMYQVIEGAYGGLFGLVSGNVQKVNTSDCLGVINMYNPTGYIIGGICAENFGSILYCTTHGQIKFGESPIQVKGRYDFKIGGSAGLNRYGRITNCQNDINIAFNPSRAFNPAYKNSAAISYVMIGGICGENDSKEGANSTIWCCKNTGAQNIIINADITLEKAVYAAGISCYHSTGYTQEIQECCNKADIIVTRNNTQSKCYAGGICGGADLCFGGGPVSYRLVNDYNQGNITIMQDSSSDSYGTYSGGIIGYCINCDSNNSILVKEYLNHFMQCYNSGKIPQGYGLIGNISSGTMTDCYFLTDGSTPKGSGTSKTEANMKSVEFAEKLGNAFTYVEGDYPILSWEQFKEFARFTKNTIKMTKLGQQEQLTLTTSCDTPPKYISSDPKITTVDETGMVTATGRGTAEIYAIFDGVTATCIVENGSDIVWLDQNLMELEIGESKMLNIVSDFDRLAADNYEATFSSSNKSVATVDEITGEVTGVSWGECTVSVAFSDTDIQECTIKVKEPATEPTTEPNYSLDTSTITLEVDGDAPIEVQNYVGSVKWISSDSSIATVEAGANQQQGIIKGISEGNAVVYAVLANGRSLECQITVTSKTIVMGDVTMDGEFGVTDIIAVQKWLLGIGNLEEWNRADFNGDNQVDIFDLALMKRTLLNR